jgi:hypothetical protein
MSHMTVTHDLAVVHVNNVGRGWESIACSVIRLDNHDYAFSSYDYAQALTPTVITALADHTTCSVMLAVQRPQKVQG